MDSHCSNRFTGDSRQVIFASLPSVPEFSPHITCPRISYELPVLRWVPDVQDFNRIVLHAVGDDMRQATLQ